MELTAQGISQHQNQACYWNRFRQRERQANMCEPRIDKETKTVSSRGWRTPVTEGKEKQKEKEDEEKEEEDEETK